MKIHSIELVGFKRILLGNIHHFKMSLEDRFQLILGTNGAGKTALVSELSPLPGIASNFSKSGKKIITISHQNHFYTLISQFEPSARHFFYKDGTSPEDNLNPGGTITIQKDLIEQVFGINQERQDLIYGIERFTQMSPARRRYWFTELCETNYDYALSVYQVYKERYRDVVGALKLAKKRLVDESVKVLDSNGVQRLEDQSNRLIVEIQALQQAQSIQDKDYDTLISDRDQIEEEMKGLGDRFFSIHGTFGRKMLFTPEELTESIEFEKAAIIQTQTQITFHTEEFQKLSQTYQAFIDSGEKGIETLLEESKNLNQERKELESTLRLKLPITEAYLQKTTLEGLLESLRSILFEMKDNSQRQYSPEKLSTYQKELENQEHQLYRTNQRLQKLQHEKEHYDALIKKDQIQCPECGHRWHQGYDPKKYQLLSETIEKGLTHQAKLVKEIERLKEQFEDQKSYQNYYRQFINCIQQTPKLSSLWNHLKDRGWTDKSSKSILTEIDLYHHDLKQTEQIDRIDAQLKHQNDLIQSARKIHDTDISQVKTKLDELETLLGHLAKKLKSHQKEFESAKQSLQKIQTLFTLQKQLQFLAESLHQNALDQVQSIRQKMIQDYLKLLQIELAQCQHQLSNARVQQGILSDLENQIQSLSDQEEALKLMMSVLSPTDGLIAQGLLGFIRHFVSKMNRMIQIAWYYPMVVQDCTFEQDQELELDYKFPVQLPDQSITVPDVGKTSRGMQEIIDLAFRITAMHYLHLTEYPLVLDEFSANMDPGHRRTSIELIKQLMDQLPFTQLFLVSHDYSQYSSLSNLATCVLCPDNIIIPEEYNRHVEIN